MSRTRDSGIETETESAMSSAESSGSSVLSRDQIFDILSNQRRRSVLHFLKQRNDDITELRELSSQVAAWENGKTIDQLTGAERQRVYVSLQQHHLPKLHRNEIVEYDNQQGIVELTAAATDLDIYLDVVSDQNVPWSLYYASLSGLSVLLGAAVWAGIYPFTIVPNFIWGVFMATVFAASALWHIYYDRRMRLGVDGPPPDLRKL